MKKIEVEQVVRIAGERFNINDPIIWIHDICDRHKSIEKANELIKHYGYRLFKIADNKYSELEIYLIKNTNLTNPNNGQEKE